MQEGRYPEMPRREAGVGASKISGQAAGGISRGFCVACHPLPSSCHRPEFPGRVICPQEGLAGHSDWYRNGERGLLDSMKSVKHLTVGVAKMDSLEPLDSHRDTGIYTEVRIQDWIRIQDSKSESN